MNARRLRGRLARLAPPPQVTRKLIFRISFVNTDGEITGESISEVVKTDPPPKRWRRGDWR